MLTKPPRSAFSLATRDSSRATNYPPHPSMKNLLPLFVSAIVLAGCTADDASNPWSTEQERADAKVAQASSGTTSSAPAGGATATAPAGEAKYSWQKKAAEAPKPDAAPAIPEGKAIVTAIRGDAGLIQIKVATAPAPGDKLVLTKEGKSLVITIHSVEGEAVIADIAPRQANTPSINVGDEVACVPYEAPAAK
jgi:hypothetical protein